MDSVEQTIANIRSRNVDLSTEGDKIVASRPLLLDERKVFEENRAEAVALINASATMPETPEAAYKRGHADGYAAGHEKGKAEGFATGIEHVTAELKLRTPVAAPGLPPTPTSPNQEIEKFLKWQDQRSEYWKWEPECIEALRATLTEGDRIQPMYAFSCLIISASGGEREFKRVPNRVRK